MTAERPTLRPTLRRNKSSDSPRSYSCPPGGGDSSKRKPTRPATALTCSPASLTFSAFLGARHPRRNRDGAWAMLCYVCLILLALVRVNSMVHTRENPEQ